MSDSEPESPPRLSAATAALLKDFLAKEAEQDDPFAENWNLSQVGTFPPSLTHRSRYHFPDIAISARLPPAPLGS